MTAAGRARVCALSLTVVANSRMDCAYLWQHERLFFVRTRPASPASCPKTGRSLSCREIVGGFTHALWECCIGVRHTRVRRRTVFSSHFPSCQRSVGCRYPPTRCSTRERILPPGTSLLCKHRCLSGLWGRDTNGPACSSKHRKVRQRRTDEELVPL